MDWENDPRNLRVSDAIWARGRSQSKNAKKAMSEFGARLADTHETRSARKERWKLEEERLARHAKRAPGLIDKETIIGLFNQQKGCCYYCGRPFRLRKPRVGRIWWNAKFNIEHLHPISRGGTNQVSNLSLACPRCNKDKFTRTEMEYHRALFGPPQFVPKSTVSSRIPFSPKVILRKKGHEPVSE